MTYHSEEYTLHNGNKIYAEYNEYNICQVTKECIEMLLDLYQQGRADAIDEFFEMLKNPITLDRLTSSRNKIKTLSIIKYQYGVIKGDFKVGE